MFISFLRKDPFRFLLASLILGLFLLCASLAVMNMIEGPRLRHSEMNAAEAARQPNGRLVLYTNQPLGTVAKEQITIEPSAKFSVATSGETIIIQFAEKLRYNTAYRVTVKDVGSAYRTNPRSTFSYSFTTHDPAIYYIKRNYSMSSGVKESDQIMRTTLGSDTPVPVYSASRIQDFVLGDNKLLVTTINEDKTNGLYVVDVPSGAAKAIALPAGGTLMNLRISPNKQLAGFTFLSNESSGAKKYERELFIFDLANRSPREVSGLDQQPVQVYDWDFAPDGTTLLALTKKSDLLLIDSRDTKKIVPLGQFSGITNFSSTGNKIAAQQMGDPVIVDSIKRTRMTPEITLADGAQAYFVGLRLLSNGDGYLSRQRVYDSQMKTWSTYFNLNAQGTEKTVYKIDGAETNIMAFAVSPNDQYLVLMQYSSSSTFDAYPGLTVPYGVHTLLIDIATGQPVKSLDGFHLQWD